jgi:signal transduction histidine kinase
MRIAFALIFLLYCSYSRAQEKDFLFRQYRVENGLPSDVIKAVSQDSLGFIWIATDEGLVKYDGIQFTTYKRALQSQYVKGLLRTRAGRLLVIGDLDLIEIVNKIDTVIFKPLLKGTRSPTDSTIWYPKSIYEDRKGNIWLGEPQSVIRYSGNKKFKRFDFGKEKRSPIYHRSFLFFETSTGDLYTINYQGDLYQFDGVNSFVKIEAQLPTQISHAEFRDNALWLATEKGLFKATFTTNSISSSKLIIPIEENSYFLFAKDSSIWASSYENKLKILRPEKKTQPEELNSTYNDINHLYSSYEGDLWISTDKGLVLLQQNRFKLIDPYSRTHFVEDITYDPINKNLYYCFREALVELHETSPGEFTRFVLTESRSNYFQSIKIGKQGLWVSVDFRVQLYKNRRLIKEWDFSKRGDFIHDIYIDKIGNAWLSQPRSLNVMMIDSSLTIHEYYVPINKQSEINLIREGNKGMYAASSGVDSYLFLKEPGDKDFKNISLPVNFALESDLNINDVAVQGNALWLASTEGLLRYDHTSATRIDLGEVMTKIAVSSVEILDAENILFSNSFGLLRYNLNTKDFWVYDESAGLPSNTLTNGGILVDEHKRVWVGTSFGLGLSTKPVINTNKTPTPYCVEAVVNGVPSKFADGIAAPYNSFITLTFSPISFPENKIILQWKYEKDSVWRSLRNSQLTISNLTTGSHKIFVRAKKNTGEGWSNPRLVTIQVGVPLWQTFSFIFPLVLASLLLIWLTIFINSYFAKKRRKVLEDLIHERTQELQHANDELKLRYTELDRFVYSVSHDLSAPLKSILGLILVARMEPSANYAEYFERMEKSVRKLEDFIKDVVSYSRNTRMPLRWEPINFTSFVNNVLQDHQYTTDFSKIKFTVNDLTLVPFSSDSTRLKIILNNLISNSIKFHKFSGPEHPFVNISLASTPKEFILTVEDNGIGIEENQSKHIFDMFYRAEESAQGSGLGLYILKETVSKLNGTVQAMSELNKGTTFIIKFPRRDLLGE